MFDNSDARYIQNLLYPRTILAMPICFTPISVLIDEEYYHSKYIKK